MSKQTINLGTGANSGTGDGLRTAFTKVNENFTEVYNLYASIPAAQIQADWNATDASLAYIRNKPAPYSLPTASTSSLGGVKVDGTTVTITNGVISATQQTGSAALLLGNTLASNIVSSSLTTLGTLSNLTVTNPIVGSVTGNAGTVTNGVYITGSYSNPSWLTSLAYSKLIGTPTVATTTVAGAVKPDGTTVTLATDGTISVAGANHNHNASSLIGTTLAASVTSSALTAVGVITTGTWSGSFGTVSGANLTNLTAANLTGTISPARLPIATTTSAGAVTIDGTTITITNGIISSASAYTLPTATTSVLGGVKVDGTTITISNGVISSVGGSGSANTLTGTTLASNVVNSSLTSVGTLTSLNVSGAITSTAVGTPTLTSSTNINLTAANAVVVTASPFRLASFTTTARNALSPSNGDMIYNTTVNKFQGYQNGAWVNLDTGSAA